MKKFQLLFLVSLFFFLFAQNAAATRLYVKDSIEITLRTGPSVENKIIGILRTGEAVEILETDKNWSKVRQLNKPTKLEGWVLGRYLMERVPWQLQVIGIKKENLELKTKISELSKSLNEIREREKGVTANFQSTNSELQNIKTKYEELKNSSRDFLALKNANEEALSSLSLLKKRNSELEVMNEKLKSNKSLKWFGSGAVVLLLGLIMGILMGRKEKKRRALYY